MISPQELISPIDQSIRPVELPEPIEVDGVKLRIPVSLDEVIDQVRQHEGEDKYTGVVPVTEQVFDVELEYADAEDDDEDDAVIGYGLWTDEERERLLSRQTIEGLAARFERKYGKRWWKHEPEILLEDLAADGYLLDPGGIFRTMALHSIMAAPIGVCPFYQDPPSFMFLCGALGGRAIHTDDTFIPSPLQMARAIQGLQDIRPGLFDDDVMGCIAACCYHHGLWALPDVLAIAQPTLLRMCRNLDIPVDGEMVADVLKRAVEALSNPSTLPGEIESFEDAQLVRVVDLQEQIDAAVERGETQREEMG